MPHSQYIHQLIIGLLFGNPLYLQSHSKIQQLFSQTPKLEYFLSKLSDRVWTKPIVLICVVSLIATFTRHFQKNRIYLLLFRISFSVSNLTINSPLKYLWTQLEKLQWHTFYGDIGCHRSNPFIIWYSFFPFQVWNRFLCFSFNNLFICFVHLHVVANI